MGNGKVTVIYRVTAIFRSTLQKIYKATENFGKLSGDRDIQGTITTTTTTTLFLVQKYKSWIV